MASRSSEGLQLSSAGTWSQAASSGVKKSGGSGGAAGPGDALRVVYVYAVLGRFTSGVGQRLDVQH
jgi:hypothetical protein